MEVFKVVDVGHDAAGVGVVFQIEKNAVHLVEFAFGINRFFRELVAIGFANRAILIGPRIPNMGL